MTQTKNTGASLATVALVCAVLAFPLWLLSFSWVPFALTGREVGAVWYIILMGEAGALVAALAAIMLGFVARRRAHAGTTHRQRASEALVIGVIALVMIVGLNILGALVFA